MPLSPAVITSSIMLSGSHLTGVNFPTLASAIGNSVYTWITSPANFSLSGVTSGGSGSGNVTGNLLLVSNPALVLSGMNSFGVSGVISNEIASVVSNGIASSISTYGQYYGVSVGVATGVDNSVVSISNYLTLSPILLSYLGTGVTAPSVSSGLSLGISNLLMTTTGFGTVTGSPVGPPTVGSSPINTVF